MKKIELEITDIAPSGSSSGAYALVLSEVGGSRKLPIVIGGPEAQAIAIEIEKMVPSRPLTHDLFKAFAQSFMIEVEEVIIYNLIEGIFFAKIMVVQEGRRAEIDARTSDAVAIAVRFDCPIYCYDFILDTAGVSAEDIEEANAASEPEDIGLEDLEEAGSQSTSELSLEELEKMLEAAIEKEDYERASRLRDEIKMRQSKG